MIIYAFFSALLTAVASFLSLLPHVDRIPYVDDYLVTGLGNLHEVMYYIPPLAIIYAAFIVVMKFKIGLWTLRLLRIIR